MNATGKIKITGLLELIVFRKSGDVEYRVFKNLVVDYGLALCAAYLGGQNPSPITHIAVGLGTTAPVSTDTALEIEIARTGIFVTLGTGPDANKVTFAGSWGPGAATGDITEAGLFDAASAGNLFCRTTFSAVTVAAGDAVAANWRISFDAV